MEQIPPPQQQPYPPQPPYETQQPYPPQPPYAAQQGYPPQPPYGYYPSVNPIAGPAKVIGILFALLAALSLLGTIVMAAMSGVVLHGQAYSGYGGGGAASFLFMGIAAVILVITILHATTAYGLLARKPWGRTLVIITAILSLISFPLGTALGGFALYFFLRQGADQDYARLTAGMP